MPVEIKGLDSTLKAMRKFEPDLAKNLNKELRAAMMPVRKKAQGFVPSHLTGLSNWSSTQSGYKINSETSVFAKDHFPKFNPATVRRGMQIVLGKSRPNPYGFSMFARLINASAAGAIMETAGRTNFKGRPHKRTATGNRAENYSRSDNPHAGEWFINHMRGGMQGEGKKKGRLLYRAFKEDQGWAFNRVESAMKKTIVQFRQRADANDVWRIR